MEKVSPVEIEIKPVDLDLTLYPSFVLSIFNQLNGTYVKAAGRKRECKMKVEGKFLLRAHSAPSLIPATFMNSVMTIEGIISFSFDILERKIDMLLLSSSEGEKYVLSGILCPISTPRLSFLLQ
jgi:hypothetical protein